MRHRYAARRWVSKAVRRKFSKDEGIVGKPRKLIFQELFLGQYMGVGLSRCTDGDPHVMFTLLIKEDLDPFDGVSDCHEGDKWELFTPRSSKPDRTTFLLRDLLLVLGSVHDWLEKNAEEETEMCGCACSVHGHFGWNFAE